MEILKIILMIIFAIDCIALTAIVLMQEGKSAGLGTISGMADTYCSTPISIVIALESCPSGTLSPK